MKFGLATLALAAAALVFSSSAFAGAEELSSCNSLDRVEERPSGQIVGVGTTRDCNDVNSPGKVAVIQLDAQGKLDPGFGNGGVVVLSKAVDQREVELALQPSGRVVVDTEAGLVGLTPAGKLDPTFGTGGLAKADFGVSPAPFSSTPLEMDMNSDGSLIVFGAYRPEENVDQELVLAKYKADGQPDAGFGDQGISDIHRGVADLKVGPGGLIYTTGLDYVDGINAPSVTRFGTDGHLDTSYGPDSNGTAIADPSGFGLTTIGIADYLVIEPSGAAILSGSMVSSNFSTFTKELDPDGLPVTVPGAPRLVTGVTPVGNLISIEGPMILDLVNPGEFDLSEQTPGFQAVRSISLHLNYGNTTARDAQVGPSGNLFGAGRMDTCYNRCAESMVIMKAGSSPDGFDPAFGNDAGAATIPQVGCGILEGTGIADERCHRTLGDFPSTAKVSLGKRSKSGILLKASLPDGSRTSGETKDRDVTVALPPALQLRLKRPDVRVKVNERLIEKAKVKVSSTQIHMDLSDVDWNRATHPLVLKVAKRSIKPLKKRQKFKKLRFHQSVFYAFDDASTETVNTTVVSRPVAKPKRHR